MKKLPIAAAALLFGTSAYAMIPSEPTGVWVDKDPYTVQPTAAFAPVHETWAVQPASADWWQAGQPVSYETHEAGLDTFTPVDEDLKADAMAEEAKAADAELAAVDEDVDAGTVEPATDETTALDVAPVPVENGVGGPYEAVDTAAADLTPRPAAQNYPACRPGPGDDNCIQLYEPGVQQQLASWTQPTGGFVGDAETRMASAEPADQSAIKTAQADEDGTQVAMGGPYEPVADDAAMSGDGTVDTALGETAEDEIEV